jgi:ATP-dependent helicase IRC3
VGGRDPLHILICFIDVDLLDVERQAQCMESVEDTIKNVSLDHSEYVDNSEKRPTARLTITEYDSIFEVVDDCSGSTQLHNVSRNAWVAVGDDIYVLAIKDGSIKLERRDDG